MTYLQHSQCELDQLNYWFKLNKRSQGSNEWNEKIERGIELSETLNNL